MDALVARYSQPAGHRELYSQEEEQELIRTTPSLSLKFALPPVPQVCGVQFRLHLRTSCD